MIIEYLTTCPTLIDKKLECLFLDDWIIKIEIQGWNLYFDVAANRKGVGVIVP